MNKTSFKMNKQSQLIYTGIIIIFVLVLLIFVIFVTNMGNEGAGQIACVKKCEQNKYTYNDNTINKCYCNAGNTTITYDI